MNNLTKEVHVDEGTPMIINEKPTTDSTEEKLFKAALLLGVAIGGLRAMYWTETPENDATNVLSESMDNLIVQLEKGVYELFYEQPGETNATER